MDRKNAIITNAIYYIGTSIVLLLGLTCLFGPNVPFLPESMLAFTWREEAFIWLAAGTIPMLIACLLFYNLHGFRNNPHKSRRVLVFLPGLICSGCALFIFGLLIAALINTVKTTQQGYG